ncbi:MAG: hypothetical protein WA786_11245 [Acidimicrobiales bacterium]
MSGFTRSRLVAPAVVLVGGAIITGAVAFGHTWSDAAVAGAVTILLSIGYYVMTRSDSDIGAVYGNRADERQAQVVLRACRNAMFVMLAIAFVGTVVTVAMNDAYWQFDVLGSVGGLAYFMSLLVYGAHDETAAGPSDIMRGQDH